MRPILPLSVLALALLLAGCADDADESADGGDAGIEPGAGELTDNLTVRDNATMDGKETVETNETVGNASADG